MARIVKGNRKLHIWLIASAIPCILFHIFKSSERLMSLIAENITGPIKHLLSRLISPLPFSLAEVLVAFAALYLLVYLIRVVIKLRKSESKLRLLYSSLCLLLCVAMTIYGGLCLMFGVNYYARGFQDKSGVYASTCTTEELYELTAFFAGKASEYSLKTARDGDGQFAVDVDDIFSQSSGIYNNLETEYPFLQQAEQPPKKLISSRLLSYTKFSGFYFPFTAEANINVDAPASTIPFTIAHEMAHVRDVPSEDEANLLAVLACTTGGNDVYAYSGYLQAYIYLSNSLRKSSTPLWEDARALLSDECLIDLAEINSYWSSFNTPLSTLSNNIYDRFLRGYGNESGIASYSEVVQLLIAHFPPQ